MGLYNFKPRFVPFIKSGRKKHTIRAKRVHPDKPGNILHLYTGLRTKKAKLLMRVPCVKVEEIEIKPLVIDREVAEGGPDEHIVSAVVLVDGQGLSDDECESLSRRDGFSSFQEMLKFWTTPKNRLPFKGDIIHWR